MRYFILLITAVTVLASGGWVNHYNAQLETDQAPLKIVSLELAWTKEQAHLVVDSWNEQMHDAALGGIYADYFFIVCYTVFLVLGAWYSARIPQHLKETKALAVALVFAGLCDVVENIFRTQYLAGNEVPVWSFSLPASIKFLIIVVGIGLIVWNIVARLVRR